MNDDSILIRSLQGELAPGERRELEERLRDDPALARRLARLESTWRGLELPPPAEVPDGFRDAVLARARRAAESPGPLLGSVGARIGAAAALVLGIGLGLDVGSRMPPAPRDAVAAEIGRTLDEVWGAGSGLRDDDWTLLDPGGAESVEERR